MERSNGDEERETQRVEAEQAIEDKIRELDSRLSRVERTVGVLREVYQHDQRAG
jgi:hypothetical protein